MSGLSMEAGGFLAVNAFAQLPLLRQLVKSHGSFSGALLEGVQ
jgi:hypothetical protein